MTDHRAGYGFLAVRRCNPPSAIGSPLTKCALIGTSGHQRPRMIVTIRDERSAAN
jgi:hypothetical protein